MSLEIEDAFKAKAQSVSAFLTTSGQGCYIPAYQRAYSWDESDASRLLEDLVEGLQLLLKRERAITFLGSIIAIHDITFRTVQPIYKTEVPPRVTTIIDGQQRLCTLVMANIVLHDQTRRLKAVFAEQAADYARWISEQAEQLLADLLEGLVLDSRTGDGHHRFYPRIIRAYDDTWSKRNTQAKYNSPISRLIWSYYIHQSGGTSQEFTYAQNIQERDSPNPVGFIDKVFVYLQKAIGQFTGQTHRDYEFVDLVEALESQPFVRGIWGYGHEIPLSVKKLLQAESQGAEQLQFCQLLRTILLARYLNNRTAFTVVTTENEDDAFDMFESLNTTGEPLTAFETFKPKVIEAEGLEHYQSSPAYPLIRRIEQYLDQFRNARKKEDATAAMLLSFALAETGERLQKRLRDQRRYLRDQYDSEAMQTKDAKHAFLKRLSQFAVFLSEHWTKDFSVDHRFSANCTPSPELLVGFNAIRELDHDIVMATLVRYYSAMLEAEGPQEIERSKMFLDAIKAVVGFSMLWRGAFGGTANVDSHYRSLMKDGGLGIRPLAFRPCSLESICENSLLTISELRTYFRNVLAKAKIDTKPSWVEAASCIPVYQHSRIVARYLLFLASDDAVEWTEMPGLVKRGRSGVAPILSVDKWRNEDYLTVEHIVPQSATPDWDARIYADKRMIDTLGNLLLLPKDVNSLLGNRKWLHKKAIFQVLAARDQNEFNEASSQCAKLGLSLPKQAQQVLEQSNYLQLCRSVSQKHDEWTPDFVAERGKCLAGLAWDRLSSWLDLR